jgi:hypothetical protein
MKKIMILSLLLLGLKSWAQDISEATGVTTLSPLTFASLIVDTAVVSSQQALASTGTRVQGRGAAGKEQLRDELLQLNEQMLAQQVQAIQEVRQPGLKELFLEIAGDARQMQEIREYIPMGNKLERIATAVAVVLMVQD